MICENCGTEHEGIYGSGRFCSSKCARGFSTKKNRKEINDKISKSLIKSPYLKICPNCKREFKIKRSKNIFCSVKCSNSFKFKDPLFIEKISIIAKKNNSFIKARERLRNIGRKGGFGKKGFTKKGTRYDSILEKECFEWLENNNILFESHKFIPNSSKISDIFIIDTNLWIELDGINREKRKEWLKNDYKYWLDKLKIYEEQKLKYKIFYKFDEFVEYMKNKNI